MIENHNQDIYLDVHHVWQEDPEHNIEPEFARKICAMAAMKIVIDYLPPADDKSIKLTTIRDWMLAHDGINEHANWYHSKQVDYLQSLGYTAWRRNWRAPSQDPAWLVTNENYTLQQVECINTQHVLEANVDQVEQKATMSFIESFKRNCPVIVSVKLGFDEHGHNHQIVLNGFMKDNTSEYFYYTDPIVKPQDHNARQKMTLERFFKYFNYLAIFTKPA